MCLYSRTPIPSIAHEDIICYKLVTAINTPFVGKEKKLLMTPFMLKLIDPKKFPFILEASSNKSINYFGYDCCYGISIYAIGEGFIHAYTEKSSTFSTCEYRCVILCRIPKGTKYYVSLKGDEICASEMELIKII